MHTRPREAGDVSACVELMHATHLDAGYPAYWPPDPSGFLVSDCELAAWVAVDDDGRCVGHVALHNAADDPDLGPVCRSTRAPAAAFGAVARLLVDPEQQGQGLGKALLDLAATHCVEAGRHPILDVVTSSTGAIAFYEAQDWQRVASLEIEIDGVPNLSTWIYAAPGVPTDLFGEF